MTPDPSTIRALAMHAALTTGGDIGAVERADRFARLIREYAETGDVAELTEATQRARHEDAAQCPQTATDGLSRPSGQHPTRA
jgi:hypothetical protein